MKLATLVLLAAALSSQTQSLPATAYRYFRVGAVSDIRAHSRAGYALMGGGTDLDEAFRWLCDRAGGGDFLILRAAGTDAYNSYIQDLCRLNSVATLIIPDRAAASDPFVTNTITHASALFIAGGDQARYINSWAGTPVETALRDAIQRGIPTGGTSAGLAVLGQYVYSAQNDLSDGPDLTSEAALADPFARQIVIAPDLLGIPILHGIITDSHFDTRHRQGRLLVFMARILASGHAKTIRAIGIDERTAVLVEPDGHAQVVGKGEADFYKASGKPQQCEPGKSLTLSVAFRKVVSAGSRFNLSEWRGQSSNSGLSIQNGTIHATNFSDGRLGKR
jgi:cyanophycinase